MKAYAEYGLYLNQLAADVKSGKRRSLNHEVAAALDGQPFMELKRLVPRWELQAKGAFFTGTHLADTAVSLWGDSIAPGAVFFDPACGAADLLLACMRALLLRKNHLQSRNSKWTFIGRDIETEFVAVARQRCLLMKANHGMADQSARMSDAIFDIKLGDGLKDRRSIKRATHVVLNPPFGAMTAPPDVSWAKGSVNKAAVFVAELLESAPPGVRLIAILPDVLRSGSRYAKWRKQIAEWSNIDAVKLFGRFDRGTDVDVFILSIVAKGKRSIRDETELAWAADFARASSLISDEFNISVGPVVDYRSPHSGPWVPYAMADALIPWNSQLEIKKKRRWNGRLIRPPFVVVRRTSAPSDRTRIFASIVRGRASVAVENHLVILQPKDRKVQSCLRLLDHFRSQQTTSWLNHRIRCRHLTTKAFKEMPWSIQGD